MSLFRFKHFSLEQASDVFKVGTDAVLLGAWASIPPQTQHILEAGTGTGIVSLMLCQRFRDIHVHAIDIQPAAAQLASKNVRLSPYSDRITVSNSSLQQFDSVTQPDAIVCNPPYFERSTPASKEHLHTARHTDQLTFAELAEHANRILSQQGTLSCILPIPESDRLEQHMHRLGFHRIRQTTVRPTPSDSPKRLLLTWGRTASPLERTEVILEKTRGSFHETYRHLTRDFHPFL